MIRNPPALAKVIRPTLPEVFPRKRLFEHWDTLRQNPVIWVSGPPGCGKTTLISSYVEILNLPSRWYNFDEGDADPATFFIARAWPLKKLHPTLENRCLS